MESTRGILPRGGTILGSSRTNPFGRDDGAGSHPGDPQVTGPGRPDRHRRRGHPRCGGSAARRARAGRARIAEDDRQRPRRHRHDVRLRHRLHVATEAIDRLHTTAESHNRVMVVEVMGRHAGWIALHSGLAGGADVILVPERPFDIEEVCRLIRRRHDRGRYFSIVVVAEGATPAEGTMGGAERGQDDEFGHERLGGIGWRLEPEIEERTGYETRATVLGHTQRGRHADRLRPRAGHPARRGRHRRRGRRGLGPDARPARIADRARAAQRGRGRDAGPCRRRTTRRPPRSSAEVRLRSRSARREPSRARASDPRTAWPCAPLRR